MRLKPILVSMLAAASLGACASDPHVLGSSGGSASAGASGPDGSPSFERLDADRDGFVSLAESERDSRISRDFLRFDKNADWRLSRDEFEAAIRK